MVERTRGPLATRPPRPDFLLLGATAVLLAIGVAVMASIGEARDAMGKEPHGILARHLPRVVLGIIACAGGALIRVETWRWLAKPFLCLVLVLLVFTILPRFGLTIDHVHVQRNGAFRWFQVGPISVMPGELFKPVFVVWLAHFLSLPHAMPHKLRGLVPPMVVGGLAVLLFGLQPAISTAAGLIVTAALMIYVAGGPVPGARTLLCMLVLGVTAAVLTPWAPRADAASSAAVAAPRNDVEESYSSAAPEQAGGIWAYVTGRLKGYVPPWKWDPRRLCYHSHQSLIALGFGGLGGQGLGNGCHSYGRLPESHTDYPLAAIGEELGWIGTTVVVAAWALILFRGIRIACNTVRLYSFLLAVGMTVNLVVFAGVNAAVVTALVPVTGQTMPFISYGGGGMLMSLFSVGVLDAVGRSRT